MHPFLRKYQNFQLTHFYNVMELQCLLIVQLVLFLTIIPRILDRKVWLIQLALQSTDLTIPNFLLKGNVEREVPLTPVHNFWKLKRRITQAIRSATQQMPRNV